ncbi:pilus assembly FimT family protein, partial [Acidithiobacillus sp.]|uniref:pilus assembly FimT family protein n=1 Tax=Acidithiobacillus sp. TaxID=1872118 RepID=UPI003CFD0B41
MNTAVPGAGGKAQGVTLIELVMAMVLLGFVAALIIPVVWYGRFGANPVPTAQATAIAQSTLEQGMTAAIYTIPFKNCNCAKNCRNAFSSNPFQVTVACTPSKLNGATAEYLTVQVT